MHGRIKQWSGKTADVEKETRQRIRARLRRAAFTDITSRFGGETHARRRSMALARAHGDYRTLKGLPLNLRGLRSELQEC